MNIQDKHRVTLLNAKCEVVCKAQSMLKKMDYGEDIGDCCTETLFAAIKLINRLDCYCFGTVNEEEVLSKFTIAIPENDTATNTSIAIIANGKQIAYLYVEESTYKPDVIETLLNQINLTYTINSSGGSSTFTIVAGCNIKSLVVYTIKNKIISSGTATNTILGVCANECNNCISDSDLSKAYAVLAALLQ